VRLATLPDAAAGEHRSHLTVTTIPPRDTGHDRGGRRHGAGGELRFQITAGLRPVDPIIVRLPSPDVPRQPGGRAR
jgi:hypothetical protein